MPGLKSPMGERSVRCLVADRLENLTGGLQRALADPTEHLRQLFQPQSPGKLAKTGQGATFLDQFLHVVVHRSECSQLWQVGYTQHLVFLRQPPKILTNH